MAKRRSSVSDGLFFAGFNEPTESTHDVQEVQNVQKDTEENYEINKNINDRAEDIFSISEPYKDKKILSPLEEKVLSNTQNSLISQEKRLTQKEHEEQDVQEDVMDEENFSIIKERQIQEDVNLKKSADTAVLFAKLSQSPVVKQAQNTPKETRLGTTQGKKGEKLKRINMGFSDSVHDYIRTECKYRGMNITEFVNMIIEQYMNSEDGYVMGRK